VRSARTKLRELLPRVLRLAIYVAVVCLVFGALWARSTRARVDGALLSLGEPLSRSPRGAMQRRGARVFVIGGERVSVATGLSPRDRDAVLDAFALRCASDEGALPASLGQLGEPTPAAREASMREPSMRDAVLTARDAQHGYVACIAGLARLAPDALSARLRAYSRTGDLAALGDFRYLYARTEGSGTSWAAVWTDGPFRPARLASPNDEGGADLPSVPAPARARRTLSVASEDGFDRFASYLVANRSRALVRSQHESALIRAGYTRLASARTRSGDDVVSYARGARSLSAVYREAASGEVSVVLFDALP